MKSYPGLKTYLAAAWRRRGVPPELAAKIGDSWAIRQVDNGIGSMTGMDSIPGDQSQSKQAAFDRILTMIEAQGAAIEAQATAVHEFAQQAGVDITKLEDLSGGFSAPSPEDRLRDELDEANRRKEHATRSALASADQVQRLKEEMHELQMRIASATDVDHVPPPYVAPGASKNRPKPFDLPAPTPPVDLPTGSRLGLTPDADQPSHPGPLSAAREVEPTAPRTVQERPIFPPPDPGLTANPNNPVDVAFTPKEQPDPRNPVPAPRTLEPQVHFSTEGNPQPDPEAQAKADEKAAHGEPVGEVPPTPSDIAEMNPILAGPEDLSGPSPPPDDAERMNPKVAGVEGVREQEARDRERIEAGSTPAEPSEAQREEYRRNLDAARRARSERAKAEQDAREEETAASQSARKAEAERVAEAEARKAKARAKDEAEAKRKAEADARKAKDSKSEK